MLRSFLTALVLLTVSFPLVAQSQDDPALSSYEVQGTVGTRRIGLNYTVRNNTELVAAHYFYASQLKDIPLKGTVLGETVEWKGEDGSAFHIHFVGNGSNGKDPLTFYNSVGLAGVWKLGSKKLPVNLSGNYSTPNPGQRLYEDVTSKPDAEFEAMVQSARMAILKGDSDLTAKYVHFPLRINRGSKHLTLRNAAQLKANWATVFSKSLLADLRLDVPHEMFVHEGQAMLGGGELWFDEKGLTAVNAE